MQKFRKPISIILISAVFLSLLLSFNFNTSVAAEEGSTTTAGKGKQKIVAVVFDNSGSMSPSFPTGSAERLPAAKYSLAMLMSLMNENDEMDIFPMNGFDKSTSNGNGIKVDLNNSNRNAVIDAIFEDYPRLIKPDGTTPSKSMNYAVKGLVNKGLKDSDHVSEIDPNKEYWLVVLTDGLFHDDPDVAQQAAYVKEAIEKFPSLHTIYLSFGSGAVDISGQPALDGLQITPYCKIPEKPDGSGNDLIGTMQKIANKISGRYPLDRAQYTVDGNKVTVDLDQLQFSLSSLSVIAQNCGTTLKTATYEKGDIKINKLCTITADEVLKIDPSCSFEIVTDSSDSYLSGGKLELVFEGNVNTDFLSIIAEPALNLTHYFETEIDGNMQQITAAEINSTLKDGDKIRVGYSVSDVVNGNTVDLGSIFGNVDSKILYAGNTYVIGDEIPLTVGTNEISIEISVLEGAYTLRASEILSIEKDPTYFRVEAEGDTEFQGTSGKAIFTVYVNNAPADASIFGNGDDQYKYTLTVKDASGNEITDYTSEIGPDGKIKVTVTAKQGQFSVYTVTLDVVSPYKTSRTGSHDITYAPTSLELTVTNGNYLEMTQYDLMSNTEDVVFVLKSGDVSFPFDNSLTEYHLYVDGYEVTGSVTVSNNVLTYVPTYENLGEVVKTPGEKEIKLEITSSTHPGLATSATAKINIIKTTFAVIPVEGSKPELDRFGLETTDAVLYFSIERDGIPFTFEETEAVFNNGDVIIETSKMFNFALSPAGTDIAVEMLGDKAVIAVHAKKDLATFWEWHFSAFITGGEKPVTVTYLDASNTTPFNVTDSSIITHILRIAHLIMLIYLFITALLWIFATVFIAKPLPSGYFVKIIPAPMYINPSVEAINTTWLSVAAWRFGLRRLRGLIWAPWAFEHQKADSRLPELSDVLFFNKNGSIYMVANEETATTYTVARLETGAYKFDILTPFATDVRNGMENHLLGRLNEFGLKTEDLFDIDPEAMPLPIAEETAKKMGISGTTYYGAYKTNDSKIRYAFCIIGVDKPRLKDLFSKN